MKVRGLLLDIEGVLVADKRYQPVAGAVEFVQSVRSAGCPLRLITNNTTHDRPAILDKLSEAGFDFTLGELHTCTGAAVHWLAQVKARRCLVIGTDPLRWTFRDAGLEVVDTAEVDAVVIGLDPDLTYAHLQRACEAVTRHGASLVALHHNRLYTDAAGRDAPSVGAIAAAVEYATKTEATVIGKPSPVYFRQVLDDIGVPPNDVLIVSDDPLSDLAGGKRLGMQTAFVLSGKYRDAAVISSVPEGERPDVVVPRIGDLLTQAILEF